MMMMVKLMIVIKNISVLFLTKKIFKNRKMFEVFCYLTIPEIHYLHCTYYEIIIYRLCNICYKSKLYLLLSEIGAY